MAERNDLLEMISEHLPAHINSATNKIRLWARFPRKNSAAYLFTLPHMISPFMIGMIWVKEKPESTTIQHSGAGRVPSANRSPCGTSAAADDTNHKLDIVQDFKADRRRTGTPNVRIKLVFLEYELIVGFLDRREVEGRFGKK